MNAEFLVKKLGLVPHPEGGYYKETYRSEDKISTEDSDDERNMSTAIYFLLEKNNISHLHRIKSDELWFFHEGNSLEVVMIDENGLSISTLGKEIEKGENYQLVVPAGVWFGARLKDNIGYALVSCVVAPGFDFKDFELAKRSELLIEFPEYGDLIREMALE